MTPAELVGQRIRKARETLSERGGYKMTQTELGEALAQYLGKPWPKQAVSDAERGNRQFDAAELLALAAVLRISISGFFTPDELPEPVVMPSGHSLTRDDLLILVLGLGRAQDHSALLTRRADEMDKTLQGFEIGIEQLRDAVALIKSLGREGKEPEE